MSRFRRFWFHYNKPASRKEGINVLTLHWRGACCKVHAIRCAVATESHNRNSQPHCIIRGFANNVEIVEGLDGKTLGIIT